MNIVEKKNNDIIYTAADIEKYHKGLLTPGDMHALEKAALDDPFLADALEGYKGQAAIQADLEVLQKRLADRVTEKRKMIPLAGHKNSFSWWKIAAMIIMVAGAALIVYQVSFNKSKNEIAESRATEQAETPSPKDTSNQNEASSQATDLQSPRQQTVIADKAPPANRSLKQKEPVSNKLEQETADPGKEKKINNPIPLTAAPGIAARNAAVAKTDSAKANEAERESAGKNEEKMLVATAQNVERRKQSTEVRMSREAEGYLKNKSVLPKANVFRGRVTDEQNNALAFSNVTNIRDSVGTYADANGFFNLTSPDTVLNVKVSSIGFEPSIVSLHNDVVHNRIQLEEDRTSLSEVVITNKKPNADRVKNNMVLQQAEPADGWSNYDLYLANNIKEPDELKEKNTTGEHGIVELLFEVSLTGEPVNISVKKSLCEACDREAIRLLKEGPKWKRRSKKGKTTVTISF